ncbi:DoxX family protein [Sulfurimonas sp. HSL-1716]|uniref:HvfX family Cu-binding RiPP maturation protein n=1 Tax=Hydrocurvibacter sulfurireducens TaxID=3131937 RepID=UPI0031F90ECC
MNLKEYYIKFSDFGGKLKSLSLLLARLVLAYGFYGPAMRKWSDIGAIGDWFASLGIPFAHLNAYMAATTEITGVVLLTLGLFTRLISIPLIVVMLVAIFTVHIHNGFECGNNGFEIPVYYILFLLVFISHGAGRFSLDNFIFEKKA